MFPLFLFLAAAVQWMLTLWFWKWLQGRPKVDPVDDESHDSVWAIVCVRGPDPSLEQGLRRLLGQSYRGLRVCVVIDHRDDAACAVVESVREGLADSHRLTVLHLQRPLESCSLKCSSLAEGIEFVLEHDPSVEYFVMFDADAGIDRKYVSRLLGPLADPKVGVASGNQWFEPGAQANLGTVVRSQWYAGAFFFSMLFGNPWAGAFAVRATDVRRLGLVALWRKSAVDDGPLKKVMHSDGLECVSVPELVTVNHEKCTLGYANRWMTRILTWSKMYEPGFWLTFLQMTFATTLIFGSAVELIAWPGRFRAACWFVGSGVLSVFAWLTIRSAVANALATGVELPKLSGALIYVKALIGVPIAQAVYAIACTKAALASKVKWRGVEYRIEGRGLRLEQYRPFKSENQAGHSID